MIRRHLFSQKEKIEIISETNFLKSTIEEILGINIDTLLPTLLVVDSSLILIEVEIIKKKLKKTQEALKFFETDIIYASTSDEDLDLEVLGTFSEDPIILNMITVFRNYLQELDHIAELVPGVSSPAVPDKSVLDGPVVDLLDWDDG